MSGDAYQSISRPIEHVPFVLTLHGTTSAASFQAGCCCGWTSGLPFNRYEWSRAFRAAGEHADGVRT